MNNRKIFVGLNVFLFIAGIIAGCSGSSGDPPVYGWAVGDPVDGYATILHTTNGKTWQRQGDPSQLGIPDLGGRDVSAVDAQCAWVTCCTSSFSDAKVFKTTDAGRTWQDITPGDPVSKNIIGIKALSRHVAWVVGGNSLIMKTTDGGATWTQQTVNEGDPDHDVYSVVTAIDGNTAWAAGAYVDDSNPDPDTPIVAYTTNGVDWTRISISGTDGQHILGIFAVNNSLVWAVQRGNGTIYRSDNGGKDWTNVFVGGAMVDANNICAIGNNTWGLYG